MGIPITTRLSSVIINSQWSWPPIRSVAAAEIIEKASLILPEGGEDVAIWQPSKSSTFTVSSASNALRTSSPKVSWASLIWFKRAIPKHCFIHWLAQLDRLPTKLRISKYAPQISLSCEFYGANESRDHLFFVCPFSVQVWRYI